MADLIIDLFGGQSNTVGWDTKGSLTDTRFDYVNANLRQWTRLDGVNGGTATAAMSIPSSNFSLEASVENQLRAADPQARLRAIFRFGGNGYTLAATYNTASAVGEWAAACAQFWACYEALRAEYPTHTLKFGTFFWLHGEGDAQTTAFATAYKTNLKNLIRSVRREFCKNMPFCAWKLSTASLPAGGYESGTDLATMRTAVEEATAEEGNASWRDATGKALIVESSPARTVHYTADALMSLGDDAYAMASSLQEGTQHVKSARAFADLTSAQTFATSAQTACGSRSENPATGGFGRRIGAIARDPWPSTARSQVLKHPVQNAWYVPIDSGMVGFGLDLTTNLRPVDLSYLVAV